MENTSVQLHNFDDRTRIALINNTGFLLAVAFEKLPEPRKQSLITSLLEQVYLHEIEPHVCYDEEKIMSLIAKTIREDDYHSVLTLIEYIAGQISSVLDNSGFRTYDYYNRIFEREYVGYRFVGGVIVSTIDMSHMLSVEDRAGSFYRVSAFLLKAF